MLSHCSRRPDADYIPLHDISRLRATEVGTLIDYRAGFRQQKLSHETPGEARHVRDDRRYCCPVTRLSNWDELRAYMNQTFRYDQN